MPTATNHSCNNTDLGQPQDPTVRERCQLSLKNKVPSVLLHSIYKLKQNQINGWRVMKTSKPRQLFPKETCYRCRQNSLLRKVQKGLLKICSSTLLQKPRFSPLVDSDFHFLLLLPCRIFSAPPTMCKIQSTHRN